MNTLTCEICGSNDIMKVDGAFKCQSCGIKYSADEVKKLISNNQNAINSSKVPSNIIDNYCMLAQNAYDSCNWAEATNYCNKIIEINSTNSNAWHIKGMAAGWQSTLQNPRISECVTSCINAINYAQEEDKKELFDQIVGELTNLSSAIIRLRADRFEEWPDEEEAIGFGSDLAEIISALIQFSSQPGLEIGPSSFVLPIVTIILDAVDNAWTCKIFGDYYFSADFIDTFPNMNEWNTFIERVGYCTSLLRLSIQMLSDEGSAEKLRAYELLKNIYECTIDSTAWDFTYNYITNEKDWYMVASLPESEKESYKSSINECEIEILSLEAFIGHQERIEEHLESHASRIAALEKEKASLSDNIAELQAKFDAMPEITIRKNLSRKKMALEIKIEHLSPLKFKTKKELCKQLNIISADIDNLSNQINAFSTALSAQIEPMEKKIEEIDAEIAKLKS